MNWKVRAWLLRGMSDLPLGYAVYQQLQRRFGLHCDREYVFGKLRLQSQLARQLVAGGGRLAGAHVVELGTGWVPLGPLGFWLSGASRIDTFDLNRHLLPSVLDATLRMMAESRDEMIEIWQELADPAELARKLSVLETHLGRPEELLEAANIRYHAPADAAKTSFDDSSIDIYYSTSVLEHVERDAMVRCLAEARRILRRDGGLSIHFVDPSDHFAHTDRSISEIHFLQFDSMTWHRNAGHRLAFHNRLRAPDYRDVFEEAGLEIVEMHSRVDERSLQALESGFRVDPSFAHFAPEELCRHDLELLARPGAHG